MAREWGIFVGTEEGGDISNLYWLLEGMRLIDVFGTTACHPVSTFISAHPAENFFFYGSTLKGCVASALVQAVVKAGAGLATVDLRLTRLGDADTGLGNLVVWQQRKQALSEGVYRELGRCFTVDELTHVRLLPNG